MSVDQKNDGPIVGYINIASGIGQEFVPSVSAIQSVQFILKTAVRELPVPVDVSVNIHEGTITGQILTTSIPVRISNEKHTSRGAITFSFGRVPALNVGDTYVLEIVATHPANRLEVAFTRKDYQRGNALVGSAKHPAFDLWFVTMG